MGEVNNIWHRQTFPDMTPGGIPAVPDVSGPIPPHLILKGSEFYVASDQPEEQQRVSGLAVWGAYGLPQPITQGGPLTLEEMAQPPPSSSLAARRLAELFRARHLLRDNARITLSGDPGTRTTYPALASNTAPWPTRTGNTISSTARASRPEDGPPRNEAQKTPPELPATHTVVQDPVPREGQRPPRDVTEIWAGLD